MAVLNPKELLDWLGRNLILASDQVDAIAPILATFPDSHALAKELIRRNWLTPYQVNQVLQGNHETLLLGNYRLRERIGEGAMGQVFKAWNARTHRVVAVKTIRKDLVTSVKAMERFNREVKTASQLEHPNIARMLDAEEVDGRLFLVMDFVEGYNLSQRIKQGGALAMGDAVELARQAALGLQHAFERGIVHRDIKPANLMVAPGKTDSLGTVKILDFGLARFESERDNSTRLTQVGNLLGTIDYVAPEQAQNAQDADIRADIYSLGCTLFYLICARPPFLGSDVVEKLGPRITGEPPSIRAVRPDIPEGLDAVIRKMMARLPEDRYQAPIDAAKALEPYASIGAPVAIASPVATLVPGGSAVMAVPVSGAAAAKAPMAAVIAPPEIPQAQSIPQAAPSVEDAGGDSESSEFEGMSATGRDFASPPTPATAGTAPPAAAAPKSRIPRNWLIAAIAGTAIVSSLCLLACLIMYFWPKPPARPNGKIHFTELKYSMPDKIAKQGHRHMVIVKLKRINFEGPVNVMFKDLPDGVVGNPLTIKPNLNQGELWFTVGYELPPMKTEIIVRAEHEPSGAMEEQTMTFTIGDHPDKKRKKN